MASTRSTRPLAANAAKRLRLLGSLCTPSSIEADRTCSSRSVASRSTTTLPRARKAPSRRSSCSIPGPNRRFSPTPTRAARPLCRRAFLPRLKHPCTISCLTPPLSCRPPDPLRSRPSWRCLPRRPACPTEPTTVRSRGSPTFTLSKSLPWRPVFLRRRYLR